MSGVKEIKSSFNTSHLIENLYPGYNYSISLTPKTTNGPLRSSPTYSFTPLMTGNHIIIYHYPINYKFNLCSKIGNDVSIKDIVVTTYNKTIKISWKLGNAYRYDATVNEPVKCVFSYKVISLVLLIISVINLKSILHNAYSMFVSCRVQFISNLFQLQRIFSCSMDEIENDWISTTIYNRTNYEIFDVIPNSQYCIQVTVANNLNTVQRENHVCTLTPASCIKLNKT